MALAACILVSVCGFFFYENISAVDLGFLCGAALATTLCTMPDKAMLNCVFIQLILVALLGVGMVVWLGFLVLFVIQGAILVFQKDTGRLNLLITYILGVILPLVGMGLAKLFTLGC